MPIINFVLGKRLEYCLMYPSPPSRNLGHLDPRSNFFVRLLLLLPMPPRMRVVRWVSVSSAALMLLLTLLFPAVVSSTDDATAGTPAVPPLTIEESLPPYLRGHLAYANHSVADGGRHSSLTGMGASCPNTPIRVVVP